MTDYSLAAPESLTEIGRRANHLRETLGVSPEQVAAEASVDVREVLALETGATVSLASALAIHQVLSADAAGAILFTRPRLRTIADVEAFERRRLERR